MTELVEQEGEQPTPKQRGVVWFLRKAAKLAGIAVLVLVVLLWFFQRQLMYPGTWIPGVSTAGVPEQVEVWWQDTKSGPVEAWLIKGEGVSAENPGPAVIFTHGNGELIDLWPAEMAHYSQRGVSVLLVEYRGFGRSAGSPSQRAIVADMVGWHDRLTEQDFVDEKKLIYHGRSMGGGYAAQLAKQRPPAALILSSTFSSMTREVQDISPLPMPGFLVRDSLKVRDVVQDFDGPVLVMHGDADDVINVSHAQANAGAARDATLVIYPGAGHDTLPNGHGDWRDIIDFLGDAGLVQQVETRLTHETMSAASHTHGPGHHGEAVADTSDGGLPSCCQGISVNRLFAKPVEKVQTPRPDAPIGDAGQSTTGATGATSESASPRP